MKRRLISILLTAAMAVTMVSGSAVTGFAAVTGGSESVYIKQDASGRCTLAAAVMAMRQKAYNEGNPTWMNLTQEAVGTVAWIDGTGIRTEFTYGGITVKRANFTDNDEDIKAELLSLLEAHPEGFSVYDRGVPHAVFLTRYDESTDTFYCADPAFSTGEMRLDESWLTHVGGSSTQDAIVAALDQYWYVSSYTAQTIPEYVKPAADSGTGDTEGGSSTGADSGGTGTSTGTGTAAGNTGETAPAAENNTSSFSDVSTNDWYYSVVERCSQLGYMNGTDNGRFSPNGSVTAAQTVTMAVRIYSAAAGDGASFKAGADEAWYTPYVDYAIAKGITTQSYMDSINPDGAISRSDFVYIFNKAMSNQSLTVINDLNDGYFSDISENSSAGKAVYKLARAGIITGSGGQFSPKSSITRAEAAAIIVRIADPSSRVKL